MEMQDLIVDKIEQLGRSNTKEHDQIIKRLDITNGSVKANTIFRLETIAIMHFLKWGVTIVGLVGIINIIDFFIN